MPRKLFLICCVLLQGYLVQANESSLSWRQGLSRLQQASLTDSKETFALYIKVGEENSRWFFPTPKSTSEARVSLSGNHLVSIFENYLKDMGGNAGQALLIVAHTHPRKTVLAQIAEDQEVFKKGQPLIDFIDIDNKITNPPSRDDLAAPYVLQQILNRKELGQTRVFGVVVDPSGAYKHRLFEGTEEKVRLFPGFQGETPYQYLGSSEQIEYDRRMDRELYLVRRRWIYFINHSKADSSANLSTSEIYSELRQTYAAYGIGAVLEYAPGLGLSEPE